MTNSDQRPVTIKDIAEICGVSRATVSAVLHGKAWVSEATRNLVQDAMRDHGYQRHLIANSLSERFARMIGVVIGNIKNPFNTELLTGLQEVLRLSNYFVIHHTTDETYESEVAALEALSAYELGGYVIAPVQEGRPHDHIETLVNSNKPLVTIGELSDLETHMVDFDDQAGCRKAVDHLVGLGHRRIACLAGLETSTFARHRIMGYVESLIKHGLGVDESLIRRASDTLAGGYAAAQQALQENTPRPTALVCFNDLIAIGAYRAAYDLGLQIPRDLSVIGFDDSHLAPVLGPPLTSVATHPYELGRAIAEILLSLQHDEPPAGYVRRCTHPDLVLRESVATPPAEA